MGYGPPQETKTPLWAEWLFIIFALGYRGYLIGGFCMAHDRGESHFFMNVNSYGEDLVVLLIYPVPIVCVALYMAFKKLTSTES